MNHWGKFRKLLASHPVSKDTFEDFLAALRQYFSNCFPERLPLIDDVESCIPNQYAVLDRILGTLMTPMTDQDREDCCFYLYRFFRVDISTQKSKLQPDSILQKINWTEIQHLLGFMGRLYCPSYICNHGVEILDFMERHQDQFDEVLLLSFLEQVSPALAFQQGQTANFVERINKVLVRLFERLGWVSFSERGETNTIFLFMSTIVWQESHISHAPTHILRSWLALLQSYFKRIVVCYELQEDLFIPSSYYICSRCLPLNPIDKVEFLGLPKTLSCEQLKQILSSAGMGYDTPMMILGGNQMLSTRLRLKNSYFFPMTQFPLLHSACVSFYYSITGSGTLAQHNIFGETLEFIEASEGFAEKEAQTVILPQDYLSQYIPDLSAGALKILMVGYQLMTELLSNKDEFIAICRDIAAYRDVEFHCIGLMPEEFARLKLPEISGVQIFPYKATPHLKDLYLRIAPHFFLNPRRVGGGGGAYLALHLGIPVLAYEIGDVGVLMKNFYLMNERADFLEFIQNYLENADFRATINEVHRHYCARSRLSRSDCCRLLIRKIREIDASLQG